MKFSIYQNERVTDGLNECARSCCAYEVSCPNKDCSNWVDYEKDLNCTLVSVHKHGSMTLREAAERLGVSFVRVCQIEKAALQKVKKKLLKSTFLEV